MCLIYSKRYIINFKIYHHWLKIKIKELEENLKITIRQFRLTTKCDVCQAITVTVQFDCLADNLNSIFKLAEAAGHSDR